jgi:hypothetical protein
MANNAHSAARDRVMKTWRLNPRVVFHLMGLLQREPDLRPEDREMLTVHGLAKMAERRVLPKGPVQPRHMGRCILLAVDAMVRANGIRRMQWFSAARFLCRLLAHWHAAVISIANAEIAGVKLSAHERAVLGSWLAQRRVMGVPRDFHQFGFVAEDQNTQLGLPADRESVNQDLAVFRRLESTTAGGVFIGDDGHMKLGWRQYRDTMAKFAEVPRTGDDDPVARAAASLDERDHEDHGLYDEIRAPLPEPTSEQVDRIRAALQSLPTDLVDQVSEIIRALDAEEVLDALTEASQAPDPAEKAAILRRGTHDQLSRESLADALGTTVSKIRTAEEKI